MTEDHLHLMTEDHHLLMTDNDHHLMTDLVNLKEEKEGMNWRIDIEAAYLEILEAGEAFAVGLVVVKLTGVVVGLEAEEIVIMIMREGEIVLMRWKLMKDFLNVNQRSNQ